jgi:hypothetical protein
MDISRKKVLEKMKTSKIYFVSPLRSASSGTITSLGGDRLHT